HSPLLSRPIIFRSPFLVPPAPRGHCPGAASRQKGRRHIPPSGGTASRKNAAAWQGKTFQEFRGAHRPPTGALNLNQAQRALATGDGQVITNRPSGRAF